MPSDGISGHYFDCCPLWNKMLDGYLHSCLLWMKWVWCEICVRLLPTPPPLTFQSLGVLTIRLHGVEVLLGKLMASQLLNHLPVCCEPEGLTQKSATGACFEPDQCSRYRPWYFVSWRFGLITLHTRSNLFSGFFFPAFVTRVLPSLMTSVNVISRICRAR
jgi:hypothetical protein